MSYTVAITSQNQIYIPAEVRKIFPRNVYNYASLTVSGNSIVVTPVPDLLSIGGSFKTNKKYSIKEEKEAFAKSFGGLK
ncbi:MAG: hypothetical protein Q7S14_02705 [bacterium]|nr:hypothetical protein [bacterium]